MFNNIIGQVLLGDKIVSASIIDILSSKFALIGYAVVVFAILGVLVAMMMTKDLKTKTPEASSGEKKKNTKGKTQPAPLVADSVEDTEAEEESEERVPRFCMLCRIDENKAQYSEKVFDEDVSLKRFCDNFRSFEKLL